MAKVFGYARVSTEDQDLDVQRQALLAAGVRAELIFAEKMSGTTRAGREKLELLLALADAGDVITVVRLDRLARSLADLLDIARQLEAKQVGLKVLQQPVDTTTPSGRLFFALLGAFAEFESAIRKERQAEGIARARQLGAYRGSKPRIDRQRVLALSADGYGPSDIARTLGIARMSVYRILGETARSTATLDRGREI
jgi:DNA invertase Pin-like site-specific DNA recombinase